MLCVPTEGSNILPVIPVPLHVPPVVPVIVVFKSIGDAAVHKPTGGVHVAVAVGPTVMLCVPTEGSNMFPETPAPLHVPPGSPVINVFKSTSAEAVHKPEGGVHAGLLLGATVIV